MECEWRDPKTRKNERMGESVREREKRNEKWGGTLLHCTKSKGTTRRQHMRWFNNKSCANNKSCILVALDGVYLCGEKENAQCDTNACDKGMGLKYTKR